MTRQISEKEGAKVLYNHFLGMVLKKKRLQSSSNDWIFSMDADELLDDDLVNYVKRINFEKILMIVSRSEGKTFVEMNGLGQQVSIPIV